MMKYKFLECEFELQKSQYILKKLTDQETGGEITLPALAFESSGTTFYCNNLDTFYIYLIKFLLDAGFSCQRNLKSLTKRSFTYTYKSGHCSNITIKNDKFITDIISFNTKFGVDFGDYKQNKSLLHYALKKGRTGKSLGADAYNEYLLTIFHPKKTPAVNRKLVRENYPIIKPTIEMREAKEFCSGYQYLEPGTYENLYELDQVSSYPAQLLNDTPSGRPVYFDSLEKVPKNYFCLITFYYFSLTPQPGKIAFLEMVPRFGEITLTQHLFELFKENYAAEIKIKKITAFKTRKNRFKKFVLENLIKGKEKETRPHIATYNKLIANALIGYHGRNPTTTYTLAVMKGGKIFTQERESRMQPVYLPIYLFAVGKAKAEFIRKLQPYAEAVKYANTDGFLCSRQITSAEINRGYTGLIGAFKIKRKYLQIHIDCINGYAGVTEDGEIKNTISGMKLANKITPLEYSSRNFKYYVNIPTAHGTIKRVTVNMASHHKKERKDD